MLEGPLRDTWDAWTAVARHRLFCQCSYLVRHKPFAVQKLYGRGAPTNIPHLSTAFLVPPPCHVSVASRPGLAPVQSLQKSGCFSEAIVWMCPEQFCQSSFGILRVVQPFFDSSYRGRTCSSCSIQVPVCFADFHTKAV